MSIVDLIKYFAKAILLILKWSQIQVYSGRAQLIVMFFMLRAHPNSEDGNLNWHATQLLNILYKKKRYLFEALIHERKEPHSRHKFKRMSYQAVQSVFLCREVSSEVLSL